MALCCGFVRWGDVIFFSCNIPPCLLVAVTQPHPVASSFSSVPGEYRAHSPFGQYVTRCLCVFVQHLDFATGCLVLVKPFVPSLVFHSFGD
jgi:hypothetical protein